MVKIVSYALFAHEDGGRWKSDGTPGRIDGYIRYLPAIIRAHHVLWPDWELRLHHDRAVVLHRYYPALDLMKQHGLLTLRHVGEAGDVGYAPMWRFRPAFELARAAIVLCHDIDSFPSWTMRRCAEEFVASERAVCVVHGCESHNTAMAGLFLLRNQRFRELVGADTFDVFMGQRAGRWDWYGADEHYLRDVIWPRLIDEAMLIRFSSEPSLINAHDVRRALTVNVPTKLPQPEMANAFAPYPGAAGFDIERAMDWFDGLRDADPSLFPALGVIDRCEQGVATGREIGRL